jgi:hypothetical protein
MVDKGGLSNRTVRIARLRRFESVNCQPQPACCLPANFGGGLCWRLANGRAGYGTVERPVYGRDKKIKT